MEDFLKFSNPAAIQYPPNSGIYTGFITCDILLKNIKQPNCSRKQDHSKINKLVKQLKSNYDKTGNFDLAMMSLCYLNDTIHLLNGKYQYEIINKLVKIEKVHDIPLKIEIRKVNLKTEMDKILTTSTNLKNITLLNNDNHQTIINEFRRHLYAKYRPFLTISNKPHKPYVNLNTVVEKIADLDFINMLSITSSDQLINLVEELNNYYKQENSNDEIWGKNKVGWRVPYFRNLIDKCHRKSTTNTLYLGIFYQHEWLYRIMKHHLDGTPYNEMPHFLQEAKARKISKKYVKDVWNKWNSEELLKERGTTSPTCYATGVPITYDTFACAYIKPFFYGGENDVDNMQPVSQECFDNLGLEYLDVYKAKFTEA